MNSDGRELRFGIGEVIATCECVIGEAMGLFPECEGCLDDATKEVIEARCLSRPVRLLT